MVKRIGILGGISAESTAAYYNRIIRGYFERHGDDYYPEIVVFSLSFQRFTDLENGGDEAANIPTELEQDETDQMIFGELARGVLLDESRARLIEFLTGCDVDGVILGCTELPLLLKQEEAPVVLLDTLDVHSRAALDYALGDG